jgi:hypothetical protein
MTSVRFLIAAACMAVGPSLGAANLFPTSPLIQLGNDTDIFFDSSFALDITDNLYTTANAVSATSWTVTPGLALEYGKDSSFAVTLSDISSGCFHRVLINIGDCQPRAFFCEGNCQLSANAACGTRHQYALILESHVRSP